MKISQFLGKPTIHPILFVTAKIASYFTYFSLLPILLGTLPDHSSGTPILHISAWASFIIGITLTLASLLSLNQSTSIGVPVEQTALKTKGPYRFSRNPMYIGFHLLTMASMLFYQNILMISLGVYSIVMYHFIILGEEKFLAKRFGQEYTQYRQRVRRYM